MDHSDQYHKQNPRKKPKTLFVCDICDHNVKSKQGLYLHKRSTHEKVFYNCEFCECKAPQSSGVRTHTESKHMNIKHFVTFVIMKLQLKIRLGSKHKVKIFACDKCSFRTQFKSLLNKLHQLS